MRTLESKSFDRFSEQMLDLRRRSLENLAIIDFMPDRVESFLDPGLGIHGGIDHRQRQVGRNAQRARELRRLVEPVGFCQDGIKRADPELGLERLIAE